MAPHEHPALPTFDTPPVSRTYVHAACGRETVVDGGDFRGLCDPVGGLLPTTTFCVYCARQDALERFAWADTNETLTDYRRRIRGSLSALYVAKRRLLLVVCLLVVPVGLAYAASRFFSGRPVLAGIAGFVVGLLAGLIGLGAYLDTGDADFRRYR